ncbi:hypothetical protein CFAM422_001966 [Trichoderma lentiforme]|uniref:Uncharacterized protein n=1 Tax=Trichoderma lentiforme TaxID=1567552 RepID=A0A9P4XNM4_9HYPO|nr:hypothetical protein CFAM422_001966 [Trichoderma lentiforme]
MSLNQFAPPRRKAFVFTEFLEVGLFTAHSCGNGRFNQGPPSADLEICFRLYKDKNILNIVIHENKLLQWLGAIPSLRGILNTFIRMDRLLPHYPEMSAKFDQDRREGRSFDALELFVHHFLHEGSVFATFGFENLHKSGILTDLHLHHILSQNRPMSEDLDLLDKAVDEIDEQDIKRPNNSLRFGDEPFQSQLLTAIRRREAQERRIMAHRLLAEVANSCQKLPDASTMQDASSGVRAFVNQVGTSASVWKRGTGAIRDICEGYKPRNLSDIVSVLQVANAMRSVVPPSRLKCSKKEFIDNIPRWASLLSPDDQHLFFEIASYLWGIPASTVAHEMADGFTRPLMPLQDINERFVRTSGLSDYEFGNSYRLQALRQQYLWGTSSDYTREWKEILTLAGWHPLLNPAVQESPPTNTPKPPNLEGEEFSILARITVLMTGAIFGAILFYLCLSRHGFSTPSLLLLAWDGAFNQVITRNNVILALYVGYLSPVDFENWKRTDHLPPKPYPLSPVLPDSPPTERVREQMVAVRASYEGDYPMIDLSPVSVVDSIMDCSPSVSLYLTVSSPTTAISPSSMTTAMPGSTTVGTSMDGTVHCEHCNSTFKLGKNGLRGQASNLQKHMKIHHPETIPNYHRVIYNCRYGCGTSDPNRSNIKAHENKHCAKMKGKQPRRRGKWRQTIT